MPESKPGGKSSGLKINGFRLVLKQQPSSASASKDSALRRHSESGHSKVVVEREGESDASALHDGKAGCIDGRELVQVRAAKEFPRLFQIAQLAGENLDGAGLVDRTLPRQGDVAVGVALEESKRLDDDRYRGVELDTCAVEDVPLLSCLRVQRIARESEGDPCSAVDESGLALAHYGSS